MSHIRNSSGIQMQSMVTRKGIRTAVSIYQLKRPDSDNDRLAHSFAYTKQTTPAGCLLYGQAPPTIPLHLLDYLDTIARKLSLAQVQPKCNNL